MEFNAEDNVSMFDFAEGGGTATLTAGKDNSVAFTFPDGAVQQDEEVGEGPWMGICPQGTTELIGEMWHRCTTSRAGGFSWPADLIPVVGAYTAVMVPNNGGSADAPLGSVELTVGKKVCRGRLRCVCVRGRRGGNRETVVAGDSVAGEYM